LQEAIEEFGNQLGGPPGPLQKTMGRLPSTDAHLLCKRWREKSTPL